MLTENFIELCKEFSSNKSDVLFEEIEDSKKICKYRIEFYQYILELRYIKKESLYYKPSSLYCIVFLNKHSIVYYHLIDIIPFLEQKSFKSCYFYNIESAERLNSCFQSLISSLDLVTSQLSQILNENSLFADSLFKNYKTVYNLKDSDIDFKKIEDKNDYAHTFFKNLQNIRDGYLFSRFSTFKPYALLSKNQKSKAIKKYEELNSKGKLLEYEKQLLFNIKDENFSLYDEDCNTEKALSDFMRFSSFAKAFILFFIVTSVLFCGFFAIYNLIFSSQTVIHLSAPWYLGFLCATFCSLFGSFAFFQYMPNKKLTKNQRKNISNIFIKKGTKYFSLISFIASFIVAILFAILMISEDVKFFENKVEFNSKTYEYNQIEDIYHIKARYNIYDDRIERSSYVILFNDKTSLDLDGYTTVSYTEDEVLPFLKNKGIKIKYADSEKQLPWYSE